MKGLTVKKKLKDSGYVLAKVARKMQMSSQNFNRLLQAQDVRLSTLEKIAIAIEKPISFFLNTEDNLAGEADQNYSIKKIDCLECIEKQKKIDELTVERDNYRQERDEYHKLYTELLEEMMGRKRAFG